MNPTATDAQSGKCSDPQPGKITFIGGNADLENPSVSKPDGSTFSTSCEGVFPLAMASVGDRLWVIQFRGGHRMIRRLTDVGIVQGGEITVISRTESGSVIIALPGCRIGLGAGMAHRVMVTAAAETVDQMAPHQPSTSSVTGESAMPATLHLGALAIGQSGRIVGYEKGNRAYREKLLSMGLTPGTHFKLTRQAPMGDPIEIELRGFKLSLRKDEAATLQVETIAPEEVGHD